MKDDISDFLEKLTTLRKKRDDVTKKILNKFMSDSKNILIEFENIIEALNTLKGTGDKQTAFSIIWLKSKTRGMLKHKGPYVRLRYKTIKSNEWKTIYLGSLLTITKANIKRDTGIGYMDIPTSMLDGLLKVKKQYEDVAPKLNRISKVLKQYKIKLIVNQDTSWDSQLSRISDATKVIGDAVRADLINMDSQEVIIDTGMLMFNQAMRRRYRSFFIKWNINPSSKKAFMGPGLAEIFIVTSYTSNKRFTKTLKQFKSSQANEGVNVGAKRNLFSPWVTNRLLRVGRATTLKKRLMGFQSIIKGPLGSWESSYNRLLVASSIIKQF